MAKYQPGQVVFAFFPFEETNETKKRPVVIVEVFPDSTFSCMITGTDKSAYCKGIRILKDSKEAKAMKLKKDSFINTERATTLNNNMILFPMGMCPPLLLEEIEESIAE